MEGENGIAPATTDVSTTAAPSNVTKEKKKYLEFPKRIDLPTISRHENIGLINKECGISSVSRIVGGQRAKPGEFPFM